MIRFNIIYKITLAFVIDLTSLFSFGQTNTITALTDLGTRYDFAYSIAIQADGKVVVAGDAYGKPCMIRFDTIGILDNTFGSGGKVFASWNCGSNPADNEIKIQSDGKIVLGTRYYNGANDDFIVARYNADGTPDISFGENGQVITQIGSYHDWCNSIAIQSDDKILAGGGAEIGPEGEFNSDFALLRYNSDGTIDSSFGNNGIVITHIGLRYNVAYSIAVQQNGKIILAGEANDSIFSDFAIARYNSDGSLDNSFGDAGIVRTALCETYDYAKSIVLQADEKILVAGSAQNGLSNVNCALVRYDTTGLLDGTFGTNGVVITDIFNEMGNSVALQPDNKIVLAGSFTNTTIWNFAALRYNADGSLDNSFGTNGLITAYFGNGDSEGNAVTIGNDGEILIAGYFNHGSPDYFDFALLRLFSNLLPQASPVLLSPLNGASGQPINPTLTWNSVSGATGYNIQVSTSSGFGTTTIYETGLTSTSYSVSGLNNNTTYYWRVNVNKDAGTSAWSDPWNFSTIEVSDIYEKNTDQLKLYQVPISDKLLIDGIEKERVTVSILSIEGKLIKQLQGFGIKEIDFCDIQNGIYILRITNSNINYTKKIMKL